MEKAFSLNAIHDESPATWVSCAVAAARLGLSERTVQRRAGRGELEARTVSDEQGKRLLIRLDLPTPADNLTPTVHAQTGAPADILRPPADTLPTGADTSMLTHVLSENAFLRGVIEQLQRDGAEVRAALRKALDSPRQLEQGTAINRQQDTQSGAADNVPVVVQSAPESKPMGEEMDARELLELCRRISR